MINVRLSLNDSGLTVKAEGHALFDKKGKDIVCSAISALLQSFYLSVKELCCSKIEAEQKSGFFIARIENYKENEKLLFQSLSISLVLMAEQYPDHIKVTVEEENGS